MHRAVLALCVLLTVALPIGAQSIPLLPVRQDLRIDGSAEDLTRIVHVAVAENGTIVVVQPDDHHLRLYSPAGKELGRFGRHGEGPGEFQAMGIHSGWIGDAFWQASYPPRVVVIAPNRNLLRTITLPPLRPQTRLLFHSVIGLLPEGDFIVGGTLARTPSNPSWARQVADSLSGVVLRVAPSGIIHRLIASTPQIEAGCRVLVDGRDRPQPECLKWFGAMSPGSDRYVWVEPRVGVNGSGSIRVTSIKSSGDTAYVVDIPLRFDPITPRQTDSLRKAWVARMNGEQAKRDYAMIPLPRFFRPIHGIVAGRDGRTWIGLRAQGRTQPWLVLGENGPVTGKAMLPEGIRIVAANSTHMFGIETDVDGVQSVVRYRVGG